MADQQNVIGLHGLSNFAISNDLERSQTQISSSRYRLTLNISETVRDTDITMKWDLYALFKSVISNDLNWPWVT